VPFIKGSHQQSDTHDIKKTILFKKEDIRKDQIILNIIDIIITLLKNEDIDINSIKYKACPTSVNSGYIEIVEDARTIYDIIHNSGFTVQNYIMEHNKKLSIEIFRERFIKSTALYCVISYLFGFGDRHLDNIMISKDGLLFHIDFDYILGCDPKFSTNKHIRITSELVDVMGGYNSENYEYFKKSCTDIYNCLRPHVNIFSSLLSVVLVIDQNISINKLLKELVVRFEIGENYFNAADHMNCKVDFNRNNLEYMIIDLMYRSKKSSLGKGTKFLTTSILSSFGYSKS
jgi:phosphatidylinositol 3-kinase